MIKYCRCKNCKAVREAHKKKGDYKQWLAKEKKRREKGTTGLAKIMEKTKNVGLPTHVGLHPRIDSKSEFLVVDNGLLDNHAKTILAPENG